MNDFRHGGVTITGFSIVDYYSINTIKVLSDMVQNGEPLNKIANIPVSLLKLFRAWLAFLFARFSIFT